MQAQGSWFQANIVETRDSEFKVHYAGWGAELDEWVDAGRLRPLAASSGLTVARVSNVGDRVQVQWRGGWYPATVLAVAPTGYQVHYDGYGAQWDEWVSPVRTRPPLVLSGLLGAPGRADC